MKAMYTISNSQFNLILEALQDYASTKQPINLRDENRVQLVTKLLKQMRRKQPFNKRDLKKLEYATR